MRELLDLADHVKYVKELREQIIITMEKINALSDGYLILAYILIAILIGVVGILTYLLVFTKRRMRLQKKALQKETTMILRSNSWR